MTRLVLHAPNVHSGGGLSLLQALLSANPSTFSAAQLDARAQGSLIIPVGLKTDFVFRSLWSRILAEWRLRSNCGEEDTILCFNNLPPLFSIRGKSVVFMQNRLLVERSTLNNYPLFVRARIALERLWLFSRRHRPSRYIVQSPSMAVMLRQFVGPRPPIAVVPFCNEADISSDPRQNGAKQRFDFIYVASGDPHKNHATLLDAWRILARSGIRPSLCLTIDRDRYAMLASAIDAAVAADGLDITNAGWLSSEEVVEAYAQSGALIYPSLVESFGLPLLEARRATIPILASELDYVRDVAIPVQTFDPISPLSIARAVRRHLKQPEEIVNLVSASDFLVEIQS